MNNVEYFLENLNRSFQEADIKIEELIKCLESLLHEICQLELDQTECCFSESNTIRDAKFNEEIQFLIDIVNLLEENRNRNCKMLEKVTNILEHKTYTGRYTGRNGMLVTIDPYLEVAEYCEQNVGEIHDFIDLMFLSYSRKAVFAEDEELKKNLYDYEITAVGLAEECKRFLKYMREIHEAYSAEEELIRTKVELGNKSVFKKEFNDTVTFSPIVDEVQFSAIAPAKTRTDDYFPINIIMYEDNYREVAEEIKENINEKVRESKSGYCEVERYSHVKIIVSSPDISIADCEEERIWNGKYLNFEFVLQVPMDYKNSKLLLIAAVYINEIIAVRLKLIIECIGQREERISITRNNFTSAFISYASQDRKRVATIVQGMKKARPDMDIFFDIDSLRSGENWGEVLKKEITKRDVLFLCWSRFARESKWVDMEWRYAFVSKGEEYIEPIPLDSPQECPPPHELQKKHFDDRMIYIIKVAENSKRTDLEF